MGPAAERAPASISGARVARDRRPPPVAAAGKSGYGTSTIRDLIPYEFGGAVDLVLAPEGVRCRLELPSDWLGKGFEVQGGGQDRQPLTVRGRNRPAAI